MNFPSSNLATLAHEIGHAYHQHVMEGLPYYSTRYAMNVAETASTFAEQIIADASIREAKTKEEKISLSLELGPSSFASTSRRSGKDGARAQAA